MTRQTKTLLTIALASGCLAGNLIGADRTPHDIRVGIYLNTTRDARSYGSEGIRMGLQDYDILSDYVEDFKPETLEGYDVVVVPAIVRFPPGTDIDVERADLRAFVQAGGGTVLIQESVGWRQSHEQGHGFQGIGMFPEIGKGTSLPIDGRLAYAPISLTPLVVDDRKHPICNGLSDSFDQQYDGAPLKIGPDGTMIIRYADDVILRAQKHTLKNTPAVVVGKFGEGRVVLSGPAIGLDRQPREFENPPTGDMLRYFLNSVVWAAGLDVWEAFDIVED